MRSLLMLFCLLPLLLTGQEANNVKITVDELAPNIYRLYIADRVAVDASVGADGLLIVDTGYEQTAKVLLAELNSLTTMPLKYIINTHIHVDHTDGNVLLGKEVDIIAHQNVKDFLGKEMIWCDRVIPPLPDHALPNITFSDNLSITFNGEKIKISHLPGGHTDGDAIIYFPSSKVLVMGDLLFVDSFPYIDVSNGGNPFKFLEYVLSIAQSYPDDTEIVGDHGPVYSIEDLKNYHATLLATIKRIKEQKQNNRTIEQMVEQCILLEWADFRKLFISESFWIKMLYPFL